jgi:hypothetical protein
LPDPAIAGGESHDLGLAHWDGLEVEGVERFPRRQACFGEMAVDTPADAIGHLMLGKEAGRWPAFLIGLLRELGPHQFDARQAQLAEDYSTRTLSMAVVFFMPSPSKREPG